MLRVLLVAADTFFRCRFCNVAHLTRDGRDVHEQFCERNPANQKAAQ